MTFKKWHDDTVLMTSDHDDIKNAYNKVSDDYNTLIMNVDATRADWNAWYIALVPYLQAHNIFETRYNYINNIRKDAVYLLLLASFGGEYTLKSKYHLPDEEKAYRRARYHWVFQKAMEAHEHYPDVMTYFIKHLQYHNGEVDLYDLVIEDLEKLYQNPPAFVAPDLIRAMLIYHSIITEDNHDAKIKEWIGLLDDPSIMVACAAANALSNKADLSDEMQQDLIALITQKELERPGIAGAFYSSHHFDCDLFSGDDTWKRTVEWMMDLMERRKEKPEFGPSIDDTLQLDISFYLHELCSHSPDMIERMMKDGFDDLALMTATEERRKVDGMEKPLQDLIHKYQNNLDKSSISTQAKRHLEMYYQ